VLSEPTQANGNARLEWATISLWVRRQRHESFASLRFRMSPAVE